MAQTVAILETFARGFVAILEKDGLAQMRYPFDMLSKWLQEQMDSRGVKQAELSRRLTEQLGRSIDRAAVNKMRNGSRKISADELVAITQILGADPPEGLPTGTVSGLRKVTVAAFVQAGAWAETWEWADDERYDVFIPDDPNLRPFTLYAAETRGPSMNRRWAERTVVVFTNVQETMEDPIAGKRYVVERQKLGGEAEHTVKLLHLDGEGRFWLMPESDDPRFQTPISVEDGLEGETITIVGRVHFAVTRE